MKKNAELQERILLIGLLVVTAVVVIPLLWMGFYDYRSVDDFWYSKPGEEYLAAGKNFFQVIHGIWLDSIDSWKNVQGTLIATFTTRLLETYLSKNYYFLTVFVMLFFIAFSEYVLCYIVLTKMIHFSKVRMACIFLLFFDIQILYMPVPVEGLYWLCGAGYYTIYYALGILLMAFLLWELQSNYAVTTVMKNKGMWVRRFLIILLGFMVSLGNLVTTLAVFCFYGLVFLYSYITRHKSRIFLTLSALLYVGGFLGNVLAPGNGIRVDAEGYSSPVDAILASFCAAWKNVSLQIRFPFILLFGAMIAILTVRGFCLEKQSTIKRFRYPLLVLILSFLMLVSMYIPTMYTLGMAGAGRIQNLQRYTLLFLYYGNIIYFAGWLWQQENIRKKIIKIYEKKRKVPVALMLWVILGMLGALSMYREANKTVTSVSAYYSLRTGEVKEYQAQVEERIRIMEDPNQKDVVVDVYEIKPYLVFYDDLKSNDDPLIAVYEYYYGKNSVRINED